MYITTALRNTSYANTVGLKIISVKTLTCSTSSTAHGSSQ